MLAQRKADATCESGLLSGRDTLKFGTGAIPHEAPWPSRTERPDRNMSLEELLAVAHASCCAVSLSAVVQ
jgi:hypothetical protein